MCCNLSGILNCRITHCLLSHRIGLKYIFNVFPACFFIFWEAKVTAWFIIFSPVHHIQQKIAAIFFRFKWCTCFGHTKPYRKTIFLVSCSHSLHLTVSPLLNPGWLCDPDYWPPGFKIHICHFVYWQIRPCKLRGALCCFRVTYPFSTSAKHSKHADETAGYYKVLNILLCILSRSMT